MFDFFSGIIKFIGSAIVSFGLLLSGNSATNIDSNPAPAPTIIENATTSIVTTSDVKTDIADNVSGVAKQQSNTFFSDNLNALINNLIDGHNIYIKSYVNLRDSINQKLLDVSKGKSAIKELSSGAGDPMEDYEKWGLNQFALEEKFLESVLSIENERIETLKNNITILEGERQKLSNISTNEEYLSKFKELEKYYIQIDESKKTISSDIEIWNKFIEATKKQWDSWRDSIDDFNKLILKDINTPIYRPTYTPSIQIPKTTYCTMRGTGVNGTYDITCN